MLRKATALSVFFLLAAMCGMLMWIWRPFETHTLKESNKTVKKPMMHQLKTGVQKDVYFTRGDRRLHTHMEAKHSRVEARPIRHAYDLKEILFDIRCFMEEENDTVRHLQAPQGVYFYNQHRFCSDQAKMQLHKSGTEVLAGIAKDITIRFKKPSAHFDAKQVQLKVQDVNALSLESKTAP